MLDKMKTLTKENILFFPLYNLIGNAIIFNTLSHFFLITTVFYIVL